MAERDIKLNIKRQERQIQRTKNNITMLDDEIHELKVKHIIFEIEGDFQLSPFYQGFKKTIWTNSFVSKMHKSKMTRSRCDKTDEDLIKKMRHKNMKRE